MADGRNEKGRRKIVRQREKEERCAALNVSHLAHEADAVTIKRMFVSVLLVGVQT